MGDTYSESKSAGKIPVFVAIVSDELRIWDRFEVVKEIKNIAVLWNVMNAWKCGSVGKIQRSLLNSTASINTIDDGGDGLSKYLWNLDTLPSEYTAS
jgi:hypothetical protein